MYQRFHWTEVAQQRNILLQQYEPIQPFVFLEMARRISPRYFFDVGANVGAYSITVSALNCCEQIYAFEPSPQTFRELEKNVRLNQIQQRVKLFNAAASDRSGYVTFGIVNNFSGANGICSTLPDDTRRVDRSIEVETMRLDNSFTFSYQCIALKIDVEGHELSVLAGAESLLRQNRALLQIEISGSPPEKVSSILRKSGFEKLFHIGADYYYINNSNMIASLSFVEMFEQALSEMTAFMQSYGLSPVTKEPPIKLRLTPNFSIGVAGARARQFRDIRDWLLGRKNI
jgi:FkbM family methyltransferase